MLIFKATLNPNILYGLKNMGLVYKVTSHQNLRVLMVLVNRGNLCDGYNIASLTYSQAWCHITIIKIYTWRDYPLAREPYHILDYFAGWKLNSRYQLPILKFPADRRLENKSTEERCKNKTLNLLQKYLLNYIKDIYISRFNDPILMGIYILLPPKGHGWLYALQIIDTEW